MTKGRQCVVVAARQARWLAGRPRAGGGGRQAVRKRRWATCGSQQGARCPLSNVPCGPSSPSPTAAASNGSERVSMKARNTYQVQVVVAEDEPQDNALKRFRREVMTAGGWVGGWVGGCMACHAMPACVSGPVGRWVQRGRMHAWVGAIGSMSNAMLSGRVPGIMPCHACSCASLCVVCMHCVPACSCMQLRACQHWFPGFPVPPSLILHPPPAAPPTIPPSPSLSSPWLRPLGWQA